VLNLRLLLLLLLVVLLNRNLNVLRLVLTRSREAVVSGERVDSLRYERKSGSGDSIRVLTDLDRISWWKYSRHSG